MSMVFNRELPMSDCELAFLLACISEGVLDSYGINYLGNQVFCREVLFCFGLHLTCEVSLSSCTMVSGIPCTFLVLEDIWKLSVIQCLLR